MKVSWELGRDIVRCAAIACQEARESGEAVLMRFNYRDVMVYPSTKPGEVVHAYWALVEASPPSYQTRAVAWVREAFGSEPADCKDELAHRFLEEASEAGQAAGVTEDEAHQLVRYVYSREKGDLTQEVGGVMLTLAPFAAAFGVDMLQAGEAELTRVNTPEVIAKCRRKNASKPRNSPLPGTDALVIGGEGA